LILLRNHGAGDRFRTDDLVLGKHTLYQLSYTRSRLEKAGIKDLSAIPARVNSGFLDPAPLNFGGSP
jgi:hypothetical protein